MRVSLFLFRPIAGHVNVCPKSISTNPHDLEVLSSTVKHEILHALGFSAGLYAFFRDSQGNPLTERNDYGRPVEMDEEGLADIIISNISSICRHFRFQISYWLNCNVLCLKALF